MMRIIRSLMAIIAFLSLSVITVAQPIDGPGKKPAKPYRILTSGKQVTVKSTKTIRNILVWTSTGHRIVEQRDLNLSSFTFNATMKAPAYFVLIQYDGMAPFTEKIGIQ